MCGIFTLIAFDEGGVKGSPQHLRLVCNTEKGDKIAIWGDEKDRKNIDTVLDAGLPCKVSCKYREPGLAYAKEHGHTHWVRQDFPLRVQIDWWADANKDPKTIAAARMVGPFSPEETKKRKKNRLIT